MGSKSLQFPSQQGPHPLLHRPNMQKETEENKTPSTFRHCIKKLKLNLGLPARSCVIQRWEWQVVASGVSPSYPKACDAICKQLQHLNQMLSER